MLQFRRLTAAAVAIGALLGGSGAALADGFAVPWQLGMQEPATQVMDSINSFHNGLLWTITFISGFVLTLLVIVMVKFNARANPTPSRTTHNTLVEVIWTVVPPGAGVATLKDSVTFEPAGTVVFAVTVSRCLPVR